MGSSKLERFVAHLPRGGLPRCCVFTTAHRAQGSDEERVAFAYIPHRTDAWPDPQRVQGCEFFTHLFVSLTRASLVCALYTTAGRLYEHLCSLVPELRNISPDEPTRATVGSTRVQMTFQPSPHFPSVPPPAPVATLAAAGEGVASTEPGDSDAGTLDEDATDRVQELPRGCDGVGNAALARTSFPAAAPAEVTDEADGTYNPFGLCSSIWVSCAHGFVHSYVQTWLV